MKNCILISRSLNRQAVLAEIVCDTFDGPLVVLVEVGKDVGAVSAFGSNPLRVVEENVFADEFVST